MITAGLGGLVGLAFLLGTATATPPLLFGPALAVGLAWVLTR